MKSNHEDATRDLKKEFFGEFQRVQSHVHLFINDLTVVSGYAQLAQLKLGGSAVELLEIIRAVEKCMHTLRACLASLKEFERRYS